ncbi:MAG: NDP-sugar synthase [Caldilineaceae bacterium]
MKSILIAATERTPLAPLDDCFLAPMLPLVDRPVMVYTIELLARNNIKNLSVVLPSKSTKIEHYFKDGKRWNVNLTYLQAHQPMGDASALRKWAERHREPFLVMAADAFIDFDIDAAVKRHRQTGAQITMILAQDTERERPHRTVQIDATASVIGLGSEGDTKKLQATGAYICNPEILQYIPADQPCDFYHHWVPALLEQGQTVSSFTIDGYWNPLDSFAAYQEAQEVCLAALTNGQYDGQHDVARRRRIRKLYADGHHARNGLWRAPNSTIHASATITPPVYVGEGSQIGADVEVGPNVVIGAHVVVDEGATIRNSTILRNTYVGQLVELDNRIVNKSLLIDAKTGEYTQITDDFLLSEASSTIVGHRLKNLVGRMIGFFL